MLLNVALRSRSPRLSRHPHFPPYLFPSHGTLGFSHQRSLLLNSHIRQYPTTQPIISPARRGARPYLPTRHASPGSNSNKRIARFPLEMRLFFFCVAPRRLDFPRAVSSHKTSSRLPSLCLRVPAHSELDVPLHNYFALEGKGRDVSCTLSKLPRLARRALGVGRVEQCSRSEGKNKKNRE